MDGSRFSIGQKIKRQQDKMCTIKYCGHIIVLFHRGCRQRHREGEKEGKKGRERERERKIESEQERVIDMRFSSIPFREFCYFPGSDETFSSVHFGILGRLFCGRPH